MPSMAQKGGEYRKIGSRWRSDGWRIQPKVHAEDSSVQSGRVTAPHLAVTYAGNKRVLGYVKGGASLGNFFGLIK